MLDVPARQEPVGPRAAARRDTAAAAVLVLVGLLLCGLHHTLGRSEQHSYSAGALAPFSVELTAGHTYTISLRGGLATENRYGVTAAHLACTSAGSRGTTALDLSAEQSGTKAVNQIASFGAPVSGRVHVSCEGLPAVFVDDADGAGTDWAGVTLLLGVLVLALAAPWGLSAARRWYLAPTP